MSCKKMSLIVLGAVAVMSVAEAKQPNIVVILADDMGYSDLGCYGGEIETPVINKLAKDGLRFTHFTNSAKCTTTALKTFSAISMAPATIFPVMMNSCSTVRMPKGVAF